MAFNILILLLAPPFFVGIINRVKSIFAGRKGPSLFQLYFDIIKLLRKDAVYSKTTSVIFQLSPIIILIATFFAGLILPLTGMGVFYFEGDIILFAYFFALARFMVIISAMDTGSSFEGMGASREAIFGAFTELTIFTGLAALAIITHSLSLTKIFHWGGAHILAEPAVLFLFLTFFFILLTENSRMPVDDPNTHLELTMIHEVMVLDNSGPGLGLILYAQSIKLFIFMAFTSLLILPNGDLAGLPAAGLLLLKVLAMSVLVGVVESVTARIRLIKVPQFLAASFVLTLFALLIALFERGVL